MAASRSITRYTGLLLKEAVSQFSAILGSRTVRLIIIVLCALGAAYLIYLNGWRSLNGEVGLPPGISPQDLQLDANLLKEINVQRINRQQHTLYNYTSENGLFVSQPEIGQ